MIPKSLLVPLGSIFLTACSTISSQLYADETSAAGEPEYLRECFFEDRHSCRIPRVYSGFREDVCGLQSKLGIFVLLDMPFSLVADTVILPWTSKAQKERGDICPREPRTVTKPEMPAP